MHETRDSRPYILSLMKRHAVVYLIYNYSVQFGVITIPRNGTERNA